MGTKISSKRNEPFLVGLKLIKMSYIIYKDLIIGFILKIDYQFKRQARLRRCEE